MNRTQVLYKVCLPCVFIKAFKANFLFIFFGMLALKVVFATCNLVFICLHLKYSIYQHLVNSRLVKGAFIQILLGVQVFYKR